MSELAAAVDASETLWTVDEVPDPEFGFYTVGSEIVQVIAGFPESEPGYAVGQTFPAKIRVIRATNGTTAATHADGVALTAANAFSDASVPDPSTGDDGDVPQVESGVYVLGPGGSVSLRMVEAVVAFDDDVATGVPIATLTAGEHVIWAAMHLESAVTEAGGTVTLLVGAVEISTGTGLGYVVSASNGPVLPIALAWRGAGADEVLLKLTSGTWTGGSVRTSVLLGNVA